MSDDAGDLPRRSSQELRELSRRTEPEWVAAARGYKQQRDVLQSKLDAACALLAQRARVADPDVHEAAGVLNALVVEHGGGEECEALAVLLNALRTADQPDAAGLTSTLRARPLTGEMISR